MRKDDNVPGLFLFNKSIHLFIIDFDALWWSFVTTTVGYGDIFPVIVSFRILASAPMLIDIGFVGMLTGSIATYFAKKDR